MNCKTAKAEIALWVGNDLDESAERSLRRHLSQCPGCRKYWRRMKASLRILQETDGDLSGVDDVILWPRLSAALSTAEEQNARGGRFNGWVPALAVAAACLAMISLSNNTPPDERSTGTRPVPAQPIRTEMLWQSDPLSRSFLDVEPSVSPPSSPWFPPEIKDEDSTTPSKKKADLRPVRHEDR